MIAFANPSALLEAAALRREQWRRIAVRLAMAVYVLVVVEGGLRKWALPQYQQVIFFLRDPLAIAAIAIALHAGLVAWSRYLVLLLAVGIALVVLAGLQIAGDGYAPLAAAYGLRNYLLYALLAGVLAQILRRADLLGMIRATLYLGVPMAVLAVIQHLSPENAAINRSYNDGAAFTVVSGVVRTTGTFTFTTGMACFCAAAVSFLAIAFHQQLSRRWMGTIPFLGVACATATLLAVSGSRTAFVHAGLTVGAMLMVEAARRADRRRPQIVVGVLLAIALLAGFMMMAFPNAMAFMVERQAIAESTGENFMERVGGILFDGFSSVDRATLLGCGIGSLSVGGAALSGGTAFSGAAGWAENEFPRVVFECGILGLGYMSLRWLMALWMLAAALRCVRRNDDAMPLLLWSVTGALITVGQMTSQGTVNAYGWLFTGWTLAAIATSSLPSPPSPPPAPTLPSRSHPQMALHARRPQ